MDPLAHTFTGAALAAAGLRRATPLATAALVIGANVPDVDIVAAFGADYASLALRRGWTHGVLALALWPFVVTAALLAWQRLRPHVVPARAGPLLALAALGVATHPTLDWLNNYGLRWLMPFDGRWFYGDALFIIDPWLWLGLGGLLFLRNAERPASAVPWGAFWLIGTWLVLTTGDVPLVSKLLWSGGLAALIAARVKRASPPDALYGIALAWATVYVALAVGASAAARAQVRAELEARGLGPVEDVMVGPATANPFAGSVVAVTQAGYRFGDWRWLAAPRLRLDPDVLPPRPGDPAIIEAASATPAARRFLTWSRFPYFEVERDGDGYVVRVRDARYRGLGRLTGPDVPLTHDLGPRAVVP